MAHIRVILPANYPQACNIEQLKPYEKSDLKISLTYGEIEATSVRHEFDMALITPAIIKKTLEANKEHVDAIVINIMGELGLDACREAASVPVVSLAETAMHVAGTLGHKFSIVNTTPSVTWHQENLARKYGFTSRLASIRSVQFHPSADYYSEDNIDFIAKQCIEVIEKDRAEVIIFGSGRLFTIRDALSKALAKSNYDIPLIEPLPTAIYYAKFLVDTGLKQSKFFFPSPSTEALKSYKSLL